MVHMRSASLAVLAASAISGVAGLPASVERDDTAQVVAAASAASPGRGVADVLSALSKLRGSKRSGPWRQQQEQDDIPHYLINIDLAGDGAPEPAHGDLLDINLKRAGMDKGEEYIDGGAAYEKRARLGLGEVFGKWGVNDNVKRAGMGKGEEFGGKQSLHEDEVVLEEGGDDFAGYKRHGRSWFARRLFPSHGHNASKRDKVTILSNDATKPVDTAIMADTNAVTHGHTMLFSASPRTDGAEKRALSDEFAGAPGYIDITTPVFNSAATKLASLVLSASDDKDSNSSFVLNASSNVRTEVYLVPIANASSAAQDLSAQSATAGDVIDGEQGAIKVNLKVPVFVASSAKVEAYCATFDPSPSTPAPLGVLPCGKGHEHTSQTFLYQPDTGVILPDWSPSVANADSSSGSNTITSASAITPSATLSSAASASSVIPSSIGSLASQAKAIASGASSSVLASASSAASSSGSASLKAAAAPSMSAVSHSFSYTSYHVSVTPSASASIPKQVLAAAASSSHSSSISSILASISASSSSSAARTFSKPAVSSASASASLLASSIPELPLFSSASVSAKSSASSLAASARVSSVAAASSKAKSIIAASAPISGASSAASSIAQVTATATITVTSTSTISLPMSSASVASPSSASGPNNVTLIFSPSNASVKGDRAGAKILSGTGPDSPPKMPADNNTPVKALALDDNETDNQSQEIQEIETLDSIDEIIASPSGQSADEEEFDDVNDQNDSNSEDTKEANDDNDEDDEEEEEEEEEAETGSEIARRRAQEVECTDFEVANVDDVEEGGEEQEEQAAAAEYDDGQYHEGQYDDGQYHEDDKSYDAEPERRRGVSKRDLMAQMPMMMRNAFAPYQWTWTAATSENTL